MSFTIAESVTLIVAWLLVTSIAVGFVLVRVALPMLIVPPELSAILMPAPPLSTILLGTVEPLGGVPTARLISPPVVPWIATTGLTKPPLVATSFWMVPLKFTFGSPPFTANPAFVMSVTTVFWKFALPVVLSSWIPVWLATWVPLIDTLLTTAAPTDEP